jgi:RNA polymerase sigma-70 factor, ECF subfamily
MMRIQGGSHDAFAALYDRYCDRAYRVARSVCFDDAYAEDAVQEAFASIWRSRATYRPEQPSAAAWILTLVRHRAIDIKRRDSTQRTHRVSDDALERQPADDDVAGQTESRLEARDLRALLDGLPDAQREVIVLAFYGQLTHTEIASQLDLPVGTVKGRMRLGLHKLLEAVAPEQTD